MERCLLWTKTKDIAKDRGFEMSNQCPMDSVCNGERCIYISPESTPENNQLKKFYDKLKAHQTKMKLDTPPEIT